MTVEGANVAQLRSAATQFSKGASALETSAKALHSLIGSATQWRGPDADRFRSQWSGQSTRTINAAVEALQQAAKTLQRNADEQEKASAVSTGGTAVAGGGSVGSQEPGGAAGLFNRLQPSKKSDHNNIDPHGEGIHFDEVRGPDGKTRLIVYLEGTGQGKQMGLLDNPAAINGTTTPYLTDRINKELSKLPDGVKSDVMLVGFSQGGMDAQNIAASGRYNVTNLVTYGSPLIQPDTPSIATVHLQAYGDKVPGMGPIGIGIDDGADMVQKGGLVGGAKAVGDTANYLARTSTQSNWIYEADPSNAPAGSLGTELNPLGNHSVATYQNVANDFDKSTDPHFAAVKQSMQKYNGTIVSSS